MSTSDIPPILVSPWRRTATRIPWSEGVIGSCFALRSNRPAAMILGLLAVLLGLVRFPGTNAILARFSPIGQLAYGRHLAALGYPYSGILHAAVRVDWEESPTSATILHVGWFFARMQINEHLVFVDRQCAAALLDLWSL